MRNKELMSIDFLLLDEKECVIQGSIHHLLLHKFKDKLKEGQIFRLRDFDVRRAGKQYRITDHQYIVCFTDATKIEKVDEENFGIQLEKFRLCCHKDFLNLADKNEDLPDVIGFLCKFEQVEPYENNKSRRLILHVSLEEDIRTHLTVWDDLADSVGEKLRERKQDIIVIVATSLIPKKFGGKLFLNASSATKIYLNGDFEVVRDFCGRMKNHPPIEDSCKKLESLNSVTQLHSIAEILNFVSNEKEQDKEFCCKAKVTEIILRNGWNYISCSSCARKVEKTESSLACKNCNDPQAVGVLRFRIEVQVDDRRDCSTFVIFDKEARKITKTTASSLKEADSTKDGPDQAPPSILNIVGKTLKFQIKVTSYNFRSKYQSFTVLRIIDDISTFETNETQQKDILVTEGVESSSSTTRKIKIEETKEEQESGNLKKGSAKRRKLQTNGKKTVEQVNVSE